MNMMLDTLKIAEDFKAAGFSEPKARALADKFRTMADDHLVTKEYLDFKLKELRYTMILSLGGLMTGLLAFFKVMDRFWH